MRQNIVYHDLYGINIDHLAYHGTRIPYGMQNTVRYRQLQCLRNTAVSTAVRSLSQRRQRYTVKHSSYTTLRGGLTIVGLQVGDVVSAIVGANVGAKEGCVRDKQACSNEIIISHCQPCVHS
jgi:hypothetical protein